MYVFVDCNTFWCYKIHYCLLRSSFAFSIIHQQYVCWEKKKTAIQIRLLTFQEFVISIADFQFFILFFFSSTLCGQWLGYSGRQKLMEYASSKGLLCTSTMPGDLTLLTFWRFKCIAQNYRLTLERYFCF